MPLGDQRPHRGALFMRFIGASLALRVDCLTLKEHRPSSAYVDRQGHNIDQTTLWTKQVLDTCVEAQPRPDKLLVACLLWPAI